MKLKKNQILDVDIIDITNLGFGVAKVDGEVIFISDTVPGDKATVKIIKVAQSYAIGKVEKLTSLSENRADRCPIRLCKACAYKCISYTHEAELKAEAVRQIFKKANLPEVEIGEIITSPETVGYRNKAQYPVSRDKDGKYQIGFYAPKSHRVCDAVDCPLAPDVFADILREVRDFLESHNISTYDEESGDGLVRHVYLRRGEVSGEVLLTVVINGASLPHSKDLVDRITQKFPKVVGILTNENTKDTNIILGDKYNILFGRDYIFDTLAGVNLKITAPSFYQVNHNCAELLYAKARELAELRPGDLLLDLYCGAGSIGLSMAKDCREVIGIEIVDSAVECARFNAENNGIKNASFYTGDAKDTERLLIPAEEARGEKILPDVVIFDPPRGGSDEVLLRHVAKLNPRKIVYISCNPATLARDMVILKEVGYIGDVVTPVDMFPGTGHVESVVCLTRTFNN